MSLKDWLNPDLIRNWVERDKLSIDQISTLLIEQYPMEKGLSIRSLYRFMAHYDIRVKRPYDYHQLLSEVAEASAEVKQASFKFSMWNFHSKKTKILIN